MRTVVLVGLLVAVGCKKDVPLAEAPAAPSSTQELDTLWALAPDGATLGFVASPHGIEMLERGALAIQAALAAAPELADARRKLDDNLKDALGSTTPTLAALGLTRDQGFAAFAVGDREIVIVPVVDRDKFLAAMHGTKGGEVDTIQRHVCKTIDRRYVCTDDKDLFAKLGHGNLVATLAAAGARGELEFKSPQLGGATGPGMVAIAQLARGSFVVRGSVTRVPDQVARMFGKPSKPRPESAASAGFGVVDLSPYATSVPPLPIVPNVTLADLARSIAGPLTFAVPGGTIDPGIRLPLHDPAPAKTLLEHCADLPPLAAAGATVKDGACHVVIPRVGVELDGWVDGTELRISTRSAAQAVAITPSPLAAELAQGAWSMAFFSRGSFFDLARVPNVPAMIPLFPPEARSFLRAALLFNELGAGVRREGDTLTFVLGMRTAWANPDDIVQKLLAVSLDQILNDKTGQIGRTIASAAPTSPFAEDLKSGLGGMLSFTAPLGILASVAIPAFMDYMVRSKKTEAPL